LTARMGETGAVPARRLRGLARAIAEPGVRDSRRALRLLLLCLLLWPALVVAHVAPGSGGDGGLVSGLLHPITGLDHVVAMIAVGLWRAQLGAPALWVLPIAFPLVMAVGGMLGVTGVPLPFVESGIAVSGIVLGLMVAFAVRLSVNTVIEGPVCRKIEGNRRVLENRSPGTGMREVGKL